jgi:hypothetical protein
VTGIPRSPEAWNELSDEDLRDLGMDYGAHVSVVAQAEISRRLIRALHEFRVASDRASAVMIRLTRTLVVLTIALVLMTAVIVWLTTQL